MGKTFTVKREAALQIMFTVREEQQTPLFGYLSLLLHYRAPDLGVMSTTVGVGFPPLLA